MENKKSYEDLERENEKLKRLNQILEEGLEKYEKGLAKEQEIDKQLKEYTESFSITLSGADFLYKLFKTSMSSEDEKEAFKLLIHHVSNTKNIEDFIRYYNQHNKTKLNQEIVESYFAERIEELNVENLTSVSDDYRNFYLLKSPLKWIATEEKLLKLHELMIQYRYIDLDYQYFKYIFEGYYNRCPKLSFLKWYNTDIIYFFQELERRGFIQREFMKNYASNIELHTGIKKKKFIKAKEREASANYDYDSKGELSKALDESENSKEIDSLLNKI